MTRRPASEPVHPGEILRDEVFPALGITKPALALALGISRQSLHDLFKGKRGITPEMALRLESVVGSTAESWLALQAERDLWHARQAGKARGLKRLRKQTV
jgi:antitoxin HigA-1